MNNTQQSLIKIKQEHKMQQKKEDEKKKVNLVLTYKKKISTIIDNFIEFLNDNVADDFVNEEETSKKDNITNAYKKNLIHILYNLLIEECNKHIKPAAEKCRSAAEFDKVLKEIEDGLPEGTTHSTLTEDEKYENLVMLVLYFYFNIELFGKFMRQEDAITLSRTIRGLTDEKIEDRKKGILRGFFQFKNTKTGYIALKDERLDERIDSHKKMSEGLISETMRDLFVETVETLKANNIDKLLENPSKDNTETTFHENVRLDILFENIEPRFGKILPKQEDDEFPILNLGKLELPKKEAPKGNTKRKFEVFSEDVVKRTKLTEVDESKRDELEGILSGLKDEIDMKPTVLPEVDQSKIDKIADEYIDSLKKYLEDLNAAEEDNRIKRELLEKMKKNTPIDNFEEADDMEDEPKKYDSDGLAEKIVNHSNRMDAELQKLLNSSREASKMANEVNKRYEGYVAERGKELEILKSSENSEMARETNKKTDILAELEEKRQENLGKKNVGKSIENENDIKDPNMKLFVKLLDKRGITPTPVTKSPDAATIEQQEKQEKRLEEKKKYKKIREEISEERKRSEETPPPEYPNYLAKIKLESFLHKLAQNRQTMDRKGYADLFGGTKKRLKRKTHKRKTRKMKNKRTRRYKNAKIPKIARYKLQRF